MKKITYLLFLALGVTACSVESLDSTENLTVADLRAKVGASEEEVLNPTDPKTLEPITQWTYVNKGGHEHGIVELSNDCKSAKISFTSFGEDLDVEFNIFTTLPSLNNGGNFDSSVITYNEEDLDENNSYTFTLSEINVSLSDTVVVYAKAFGKDAGTGLNGKTQYFTYKIQEVICDEVVCESGYMIGDKDFNKIGTSNNWGWAHKFNFQDGGSETREIHHKNGSLNGTVTFSYINGVISVEEGKGVSITHLYISNDEPTETNAPGQFDKTQIFEDEDGSFWVMVKAEVCE